MPLELLTFLSTFVLRAVQEHAANKQAQEADRHKYNQETGELEQRGHAAARGKIASSLFSKTSCILAVMAFMSVIVWPKFAPYFYPDVPVFMAYPEEVSKFLFFGTAEKMKFQEMEGMVITDLDKHLTFAIAGLFFGSVRRRFK